MAVNPPLLAHLEKLMIGLHYDVKAFLRVLYQTQAYQNDATKTEIAAR